MKRFLSIPVIAFVVLLLYMFLNKPQVEENKIEDTLNFEIKGQVVSLEIADTVEERRVGLMNRAYLEANSGMVFIYTDSQKRSFWMKSCDIPLDIIFLNSEKKVINIIKSAPICKVEDCPLYPSAEPAMYVIEMNGGWTDKYGLVSGDTINIP